MFVFDPNATIKIDAPSHGVSVELRRGGDYGLWVAANAPDLHRMYNSIQSAFAKDVDARPDVSDVLGDDYSRYVVADREADLGYFDSKLVAVHGVVDAAESPLRLSDLDPVARRELVAVLLDVPEIREGYAQYQAGAKKPTPTISKPASPSGGRPAGVKRARRS